MTEYIEDRYPRVVVTLNMELPFYAQMFYSVPNEVSTRVPTAGTNGKQRWFNPEFMDSITDKHKLGVTLHEVLHDILGHSLRRGTRDPKIWNIACDCVDNEIITKPTKDGGAGLTIPDGGILMPEYFGMTEEEIYEDLLRNPHKMPQGDTPQDVEDFPGSTEEMHEANEQRKANVLSAAATARKFETLPAWAEALVAEILVPREKWHEHLRRYFLQHAWNDYDYQRLNRRELMRSNLIAPSLYSERMRHLVIGMDESGSCSERMLENFSAHLNDILREVKPELTTVLHFDTEVSDKVDEYTEADYPVVLHRHAGGGTSFVDVCQRAEELGADALLVFTDMEGDFPAGCTVPVIWCRTEKHAAPFGETIDIEVE